MNKEDWTQLRNNIPNIVLFVFVSVIVCLGIYELLFFVSESGINAEGDDTNPRLWASLWIGFILTAMGFHLYFDKKKKLTILKDGLMILRHHHGKDLWSKSTSLDEFDPDKDLVLGLILESQGIVERFNSNTHELGKILEKLDGDEAWYEKLENLDELILDNIEDWMKRYFPKEVYFLRLRLLDDFIHATDQGKFLVYDRPQGLSSEKVSIAKSEEQLLDSGGDITREFYKLILNKYYSIYQGFQAQPFNFDHRLFRKYFLDIAIKKKLASQNK